MSGVADCLVVAATASDIPELELIADECGLSVEFAAELARSYALLRVARCRAELCGFALAWRAADELHVTDLGVRVAWRRRGVGRRLLAALRAEAESSGTRVILLEVRESNAAARTLYVSCGFRELDRRVRYYSDTDEDAVVMQLELR